MSNINLPLLSLLISLYIIPLVAPNQALGQGQFTGEMQVEGQFYDRDEKIGASNTPHYDDLKSGGDSWFALNYYNPDWDMTVGMRFDGFFNSNLHNPGVPYTAAGIGRFYFNKTVDKLDIYAGYIYDQFGSGLTFRSFEERPLGIDNALLGLDLTYHLTDSWFIKGIMGKQKNRFELFEPIIMGANIEGSTQIGESLFLSPGVSVVNRTIDQESMNSIVANVNALPLEERFVPRYNSYMGSVYNTLAYKNWSWYIEYALKSEDVIQNADNSLEASDGSILYTNLGYSRKGFGVTAQYRRTDHFVARTSPNELGLLGVYNFLPSLTKQNTYRLNARYNPVAQDLGENTYQIDVVYTPKKGYTITANYSDVTTLGDVRLYRELYGDIKIKTSRKWNILLGAQYQQYNQELYEVKADAPMVEPVTPFFEFLYKFSRKTSLRVEGQYMLIDKSQDLGGWVFGQAELNVAPHWSFSVADMYNYKNNPKKNDEKLHYPTFLGVYTTGANRIFASYTKQVEGIVCTGGVCRFEPAFSGVKIGFSSTF